MNLSEVAIANNKAASRWEARVNDRAAFLDYALTNQELTLIRTVVPRSLEGQGIGSKLARAALDYARAEGMTVIPKCPFVAAFIEKNPDYKDLVSPSWS